MAMSFGDFHWKIVEIWSSCSLTSKFFDSDMESLKNLFSISEMIWKSVWNYAEHVLMTCFMLKKKYFVMRNPCELMFLTWFYAWFRMNTHECDTHWVRCLIVSVHLDMDGRTNGRVTHSAVLDTVGVTRSWSRRISNSCILSILRWN